jgi:gluconokinase
MPGQPVAVVVMGVTGSGKTTVGKLLAERMGCSFFDADDFHPETNVEKMRNGQPLDDADRAPWLIRLRELIDREFGAGRSLVLACSALRAKYRDALLSGTEAVRFVYLKIRPETAIARLAERAGHYMPASLVPSQFEALEEPEGVVVVDGELAPVEAVNAALQELPRKMVDRTTRADSCG